jgi:hypothetical protein
MPTDPSHLMNPRRKLDTLVFWPVDPSPGQVELLVREVVPLLSSQIPDRGEQAE